MLDMSFMLFCAEFGLRAASRRSAGEARMDEISQSLRGRMKSFPQFVRQGSALLQLSMSALPVM